MDKDVIEKFYSNHQQLAKLQSSNVQNTWWSLDQFKHLLHWVSIPHKMQNLAKEILKKIAIEYSVIFEVWKVKDLRQDPYVVISIRAVQPTNKLCQFLNHMTNLYRPIALFFPFQIYEAWVFNRYGSYLILDLDLECIICLNKKTVSPKVCCGKSICRDCLDSSKPCPYCRQKSITVSLLTQEAIKHYQGFLNQQVKEFLLSVGFEQVK